MNKVFWGLVILVVIATAIVLGVYVMRRSTASSSTLTPTSQAPITEETTLKDISGGKGTGFATRNFANGVYTHTVSATLPDPPAGQFYEGWLVRGKPGEANFEIFSTGKMSKIGPSYNLTYTAQQDYPEHRGVVITVEKVDDKKPETHILEGSF